MRILGVLLAVIALGLSGRAQVVYQGMKGSIYDYIDELANEGWIDISTAVKPYSRQFIAEQLTKASDHRHEMTDRQQKDWEFYLKDYRKELMPTPHSGWKLNKGRFLGKKQDIKYKKRLDLFYYKDSLFTFTVNPILGGRLYYNDSGSVYHRWNGAEAWGYMGDHLGVYASLRDNGVSRILSEYHFLTNTQGANYKANQGGVNSGGSDFSEMKGGINLSWNWGSVGIMKDNFTWGNNYNGANIFSSRAPSFAYLNLHLYPVHWFEMNYKHGWLVSEVLDSSRSYSTPSGNREVMVNKYLATNLFTFKPVKKVRLSLGNSVIYDYNLNPVYLIPVMFYKSIDHTYNGAGSNNLGQNAQMFADLSVRALKHVHVYGTWFIDELSITNMWDKDNHTNLFSLKGGIQVSNLVPNLFTTFEYTRTNPWTYQHQIESTTFESNQFNLGHYLEDNAEEIYAALEYRPIRGLRAKLSYTRAQKGPQVDYQLVNGVPNVLGLNWLESVDWEQSTVSLRVIYELINDGYVFFQAAQTNTRANIPQAEQYAPTYLYGKQLTFVGGLNFGF